MTATDKTEPPHDPCDTLARELHDQRARGKFGTDFDPYYDTLSDIDRLPWQETATKVLAKVYPDLVRRLRFAEMMERQAGRHARQCDLDVAEAGARVARLEAEIAALRSTLSRRDLELYDLRNPVSPTGVVGEDDDPRIASVKR